MPQPISVVREDVQAFGLVVEKAISQKKTLEYPMTINL